MLHSSVQYCTQDPIENLQIRITINKTYESKDEEDKKKGVTFVAPASEQRIVRWQEKIFSPSEVVKFFKMKDPKTPQEKLWKAELDKLISGTTSNANDSEDSGVGLRQRKRSNASQPKTDENLVQGLNDSHLAHMIFTYVEKDDFFDEQEVRRRATTSKAEPPLAKAILEAVKERAELASSSGKSPDAAALDHPFFQTERSGQTMYIMAAVGGFVKISSDDAMWVGEEHTLCTIRAFDDGTFVMKPGLSVSPNLTVHAEPPPGVSVLSSSSTHPRALSHSATSPLPSTSTLKREYRMACVGTQDKYAYTLELFNDSERNEKLEALRSKAAQQLQSRAIMLRRNLVGTDFTEKPLGPALRVHILGEIIGARNFFLNDLFIEYELDLPPGWTHDPALGNAPQRLHGRTHICKVSTSVYRDPDSGKPEKIVHFAHPFEISLMAGTAAQKPGVTWPKLYIQVCSYDGWERYRIDGYTYTVVPCESGSHTFYLKCWRPKPTLYELIRGLLIGGSPELRDARYVAIPPEVSQPEQYGAPASEDDQKRGVFLNKHGFRTEVTGDVKIRLNVLIQQREPPSTARPTTPKSERRAAALLRSSVGGANAGGSGVPPGSAPRRSMGATTRANGQQLGTGRLAQNLASAFEKSKRETQMVAATAALDSASNSRASSPPLDDNLDKEIESLDLSQPPESDRRSPAPAPPDAAATQPFPDDIEDI